MALPSSETRCRTTRVEPFAASPALLDLDVEARRLNISRQAVIKTMLSRALEEKALHRAGRKKAS
jgi:hypothetical protein